MLKRNETLIKTKLWQYLIPSIMTNMALQLGNVVDTILVGNILGADAMSAVQIGGTIMLLIQIPGYMLGIGGSIVAGIRLGKRDVNGAGEVFSGCLWATLLSGLLLMLCALGAGPIARALTGDSKVLVPEVTSVVRMTFLGTPVIGLALLMINFMAVDNNPALATVYVVISNVVNLISDYVLLKYTPIGAAGSVVSTVLGYGLALVTVYFYARSPKRMLGLRRSFRGLWAAAVTGVPALLSIVCEMIRNSIMNVLILRLIGEDAVAIYTICLNLVMICELFLGGIIEAMNKIGGVIYGERDYFGIRSLSKNILRYSYVMLAVLMLLLYVFTRQAAMIFGIDDPVLLAGAEPALHIFLLALPAYVLNRFFIAYYQTTERTAYSNLITVLEYCGALLPAVFLAVWIFRLLGANPLNGVMLGLVAGELLTVLAAVLTVRLRNPGQGLLCLPKEIREDVLDLSVHVNLAEVGSIPREILAFCQGKLASTQAHQIAVAAEEMAVNTIKYGGKSLSGIDLMLCLTEDSVLLRLRDNGIPFDPTDYSFDGDEFEYSGIELVRRITSRISYLRLLDMNNTTLEIDRKALA